MVMRAKMPGGMREGASSAVTAVQLFGYDHVSSRAEGLSNGLSVLLRALKVCCGDRAITGDLWRRM